MPQSNVPQHPANQQVQQQGLGAPQGAPVANPYFSPSVALQGYNDKVMGAQGLQLARAAEAGAQANKANTEAALLQQAQGLGGLQAGPEVTPQQVQARQMADAILQGSVTQEDLAMAIQSGELDPGVAEAAMGMAQNMQAQTESQYNQAQGLGSF